MNVSHFYCMYKYSAYIFYYDFLLKRDFSFDFYALGDFQKYYAVNASWFPFICEEMQIATYKETETKKKVVS